MGGASDSSYMREALAEARKGWGLTNPNPMVGALIVREGEVLGRGWHHGAGLPHAEIEALNDARRRGADPAGAELFVTLEPCSTTGRTGPCTEAILAAGIRRVVVGGIDPNPRHAGRGVTWLRERGVEVETGVLEPECAKLNYSFFKWIVTGRPHVTVKLATTLDGRIATASGDSRWITGPAARSRVQKLRRLADAIMVGGETCRKDSPRLTVREPADWPRQPWRLVATRDAALIARLPELYPDGRVEAVDLPDPPAWEALLDDLGRRGMVNLLIEGGGELAASVLAARAADRVEFHIAPKILGGRESRPAVGGASPERLALARGLRNVEVERLGEDVLIAGDL
ncbi:MAG: bifunctional diaminohydroxyphosphoribosylaminopyrimidine deaminase/5-amino-6-(5-phosphoribosylamino)uracil reductase RibD [Lentisphaeria bacterium]|nr:bifunctional diaminohydroxyphosphoribosylaminopyrimidine deaminase/5-amino-6-(5-phosphoribosylamino)uracil reductase RibD [Lentisphaeria bacterium]